MRAPLDEECVDTIIEHDIKPKYNAVTGELTMPASEVSEAARARLLFYAPQLHPYVLRKALQSATGATAIGRVLDAVGFDRHTDDNQRRLLRELCILFALGTSSVQQEKLSTLDLPAPPERVCVRARHRF